jgi:hypothetical protein
MSVPLTKFAQPTIAETVVQYSDHLPTGEVWGAKLVEGTVINDVIFGAAKPFNITQGRISDLADDFNINQTAELISDWETSVGLPDDCFGIVNDISERRALVRERFARVPVVTLAEQQAFVDTIFIGVSVTLIPGEEYEGFDDEFDARFILVVEIGAQLPLFEFDFEILFTGGANTDALECLLRKIVPANVVIVFVEETS